MAGVKSWSRTAASNVLSNTGFTMDEGMAPSALNDSVRQLMADVATEFFKGADVASATTPDITGTATTSGGFIHITGTVTITGFATATAGVRRRLVFDGALTLTHNATSLILPGGANITTAANDVAEMVSEGSGNWRCTNYVKATGKAVLSLRAKAGSTTKDISIDGAQNVTGLGLTPIAVFAVANIQNTAGIVSFGMSDGTTSQQAGTPSSAASDNKYYLSSDFLYIRIDSGNLTNVTCGSFASGQFTLTWTKSGSPTGTATIIYLALGY